MRFVLTAIAVLSLWGCGTTSHQFDSGSTEVTGIADPAFQNKYYAHILVDARAENTRIRHALEAALVNRLKSPWSSPHSALLLFGEEGGQSQEDYDWALMERKIEAILVLSNFVEGGDSVYVPGSSRTLERTESSTAGHLRKDSTTETKTVNTEYTEPYTKWQSWWDCKVALIDKATGKKAWIGQLRVKGDLENESVCASAAKQLYAELKDKTLLP